jgi:hypothetical protein
MGLEPGMTNTLTIVVDESMTADRFGNSGMQVLAHPDASQLLRARRPPTNHASTWPGPGNRDSTSTSVIWRPPRSACASHSGRPSPSVIGGDSCFESRPTTTRSALLRARTYASSSTWRGSWGALPARGAEKGPAPQPGSRSDGRTVRGNPADEPPLPSTFCRPDGRQATTRWGRSIPSPLFGRLPLMLLSVALFTVP